MPGNVVHQFSSGKADDADATLIRPSNWNDNHLGASEVLDRDLDEVDVVSSVSETSIYSHSIPANQLGTTGGIRLHISGDILFNVGGEDFTIKVKLGATTVLTSTAYTPGTSATRRGFVLDVLFMNSAAAAQKWDVKFLAVLTAENFSIDRSDTTNVDTGSGIATSTEDTTGALTLDVTVQWSASSANLSFRKQMAVLEELPYA